MSLYRQAKRASLRCIRACGGFRVCERLVGHGLHILCYHGISLLDEERFDPALFMTPELFAARMDWLANNGFRPLPLAEAVTRLQERTLPPRAVVLTFDDGWFGCLDGAFAKLKTLGWPATLYVTTYYSQHRDPVFNVAVRYLLWKSTVKVLELATVHEGLRGSSHPGDAAARARTADELVEFALAQLRRDERRQLLYALAQRLEIDPVELFERRRVMTLLDLAEIRQAASQGISVQLHTHRHRFPLDDDAALRRELNDNRSILEAHGFTGLVHFCYPSGVYDRRLLPVLRASNIETATRVDPGINFPGTDPLLLTRFLDSTSIGEVEFAAELYGVGEVLRSFRSARKQGSLEANAAARGHA
jgi:peptidoglycan/xylan/chitin deacetylase (PgdA/CDA1 family)